MTHETEVESQINFSIQVLVVPFQDSVCEIPHNYHYIVYDSGCNLIEFKPGEQRFLMELKERLCPERKQFSQSSQLTERFGARAEFDIDLCKDVKNNLVAGAVLAHLSILHNDIQEHHCNLIKVCYYVYA